jgi:mannitol-1-phosphate 5-dehydrogenase
MVIETNKLVVFGAGKIGRSFIGPLFSNSGFEVVFIDIDNDLIQELNNRHSYKIIIKSDSENQVRHITNVRGIHAGNVEKVAYEVATARIVAVSVGPQGINNVLQLISDALISRYREGCMTPLDIIIAENLRDGENLFRTGLEKFLPAGYPIDKLVGLIEASIGKMVPIMPSRDSETDKLLVYAEPYNTLILNKTGFKNPIPDVPGLAPKDNIKAWVDRKLFIHNLGHVTAAYVGHFTNPGFKYIWEALEVPEIFDFVKSTMQQSAMVLVRKYPYDFSQSDLEKHINDLLNRFRNKALGDTIFRVGCDLRRKLGPHDRLVGALTEAWKSGMPYDKILITVVLGVHFKGLDEHGKMLEKDIEFINEFKDNIHNILKHTSGLEEIKHAKLFSHAELIDQQLKNQRFSELLE